MKGKKNYPKEFDRDNEDDENPKNLKQANRRRPPRDFKKLWEKYADDYEDVEEEFFAS
jgi:hypothetical protein